MQPLSLMYYLSSNLLAIPYFVSSPNSSSLRQTCQSSFNSILLDLNAHLLTPKSAQGVHLRENAFRNQGYS